jgi:hypothetical protein
VVHGNLVPRFMAGIFDRFPELLLHPCADKQSAEDKLGFNTRGSVEAPTLVRSSTLHESQLPLRPLRRWPLAAQCKIESTIFSNK